MHCSVHVIVLADGPQIRTCMLGVLSVLSMQENERSCPTCPVLC
jgi:hypothetical protein